ncbi:MAG: DUF2784 domain-containing protein [Acidobacteriaceae bacterium]|nr:DUF2784 domain-containing protein [Acidobacteriaceae bacterium]
MEAFAAIVLALHLLWILWVIFGAFWTRGRLLLTAFHLISIAWGIGVEVGPLTCPLTTAEQLLENKAGINVYRGDCLVHYLDRIVYPNIPESLLVYLGLAVCAVNLLIYVGRYFRSRSASV